MLVRTIAGFMMLAGVAVVGCGGGDGASPRAACECADQITGLTCGQIRDTSMDLSVQIPACDKICAIDGARAGARVDVAPMPSSTW